MRLIELRQRAAKLVADADEIRKKAKAEDRRMTSDEVSKINKLIDDSQALDAEILAVERLEDRDRQLGGGASSVNRDGNTDHSPGAGRDMTQVTALQKDERMADWVRANDPSYNAEYEDLTFGGFLRAMVCGPRNDVERRALAEGTDSAGGYTVPSITSGQLVDGLRAASVTLQAGAQIVPLESDSTTIARIATDATVEWLSENATQTASDPTFAGVVFVPKTLRALVRASRELVEDSINIEQALMKMFIGSMSVELDRAALYGSGSGAEPTGVKNMTGIGSVSYGTNGNPMLEATIYPAILDNMYEVDVDNAGPNNALIMAPRTLRDLNKLQETTATSRQPLQAPEVIANLPKLQTTSIPINETQGTSVISSTILAGRWDNLFIGMRTKLRVEVLKERYADSFQLGFLAYLRADIQAAHVEAFAELVDIEPRA